MRNDFVNALNEILDEDTHSILMTGDLGFKAFEALAKKLGKRFINAGIAEQNMIGVAAGMALSKMRPWVYSITPFLTLRCLEQIRNDVCFHNLPVRLVGNGGGYTYGVMGSTHQALEDLGVLKSLPNMTLYFPGVGDQVRAAADQMRQLDGPSYLRLAISAYSSSIKPISENRTTLTRRYNEGLTGTIIGVGHAVQIALKALEKYPERFSDFDIYSLSKFPFDLESDHALLKSVSRTQNVIIIDEHYQAGGIGESLLPYLPVVSNSVSFMNAVYFSDQRYGSPSFHLMQSGLTPEDLLGRINLMLRAM